jgi:hypothetical protein
MCFHNKAEYAAWLAARNRRAHRDGASKAHAKSDDRYAVIVLRDEKGEWVAGWHCDPRNAQDVGQHDP